MERKKVTIQKVEDAFRPVVHEEDGVYWAEVPALPGCFTVAERVSDLKDSLIEAIRCWMLTRSDMQMTREASFA